MRLFSEFASCWAGAIFTSEAEAVGCGRQTEEQGGFRHSYGYRTSKRPHWKPKLKAISEDGHMTEVNRGGLNRRPDGVCDMKRLAKVKSKSPVKAALPLKYAEDYWKSSEAMALPAFSPTSFLF